MGVREHRHQRIDEFSVSDDLRRGDLISQLFNRA
jgi:hypothetical protein